MSKLTAAERGGKRANAEARGCAAVRGASDSPPRACLGGAAEGMGERRRRQAAARAHPRLQEHEARGSDLRVARRGEGACWHSAGGYLGTSEQRHARDTIRVDSKVVAETEFEGAKNDESRWMRFTLDTVGKREWPTDQQGGLCIPRISRSWRASSNGRSTRPGGTCGASSASGC